MGKTKTVKVFINDEFIRFHKVKDIPKVGDIFILCHSSKFINDRALIVDKVIYGRGFTKVHLKEE